MQEMPTPGLVAAPGAKATIDSQCVDSIAPSAVDVDGLIHDEK